MRQGTGGYLQNFKLIHTKLKEIDLRCSVAHFVIEIQAINYDAARVRRLCMKFQANTSKDKHFHFGGSFFFFFFFGGGGFGGRGIGLRSISNLD